MELQQYARRNRRAKAGPIFPSEIFFEILTWLSVETLLKLKCVCKEWYAMIEEKSFIDKHLYRSIRFAIAYTDKVKKTPNMPTGPAPLDDISVMICGCRGLLLQRTLVSAKYQVRNPATRRILDLPDPAHKIPYGVAFTYMESTGEYKIVTVYRGPNETPSEGCELLVINENGDLNWKQLKMPEFIQPNSRGEKLLMVPTTKAVHLVKLVATTSSYYIQVDSFDLINETFTSTTMPKGFFSDLSKVRPFNIRGNLAFGAIDIDNSELHILLMKDHKEAKWAKLLVVYPLNCMDSEDMEKLIPLFVHRGWLWFWVGGEKMIAYDIEEEKIARIEVAPEGKKISSKIYLHPSSLVFLKGMRPETHN